MLRLLLLPFLLVFLAGATPKLVPDVSQRQVDIVYSFTGAELLLFGAILYPGGRLPSDRADIIVVLRGPAEPLTIRKKERLAGIWVNRRSARFETVPSYFAVAGSAPVRSLVDDWTATVYELGVDTLQLSPTSGSSPEEAADFEHGLIDLRKRAGLYLESEHGVEITQGVLYRARLPLPARVPVGTYVAETFLIQNGNVVAQARREITIDKSGFERFVYVAAQRSSFLYGLTAVLIAVTLGWLAGVVFRRK
jgi:uncharacterized protein (TIGR02186 family)